MRSTIDSAGRLVVPKPLREELGIGGGQEVELTARDGRIEIEIPATPMHLEGEGTDVWAVPDREVSPLTAARVREELERARR